MPFSSYIVLLPALMFAPPPRMAGEQSLAVVYVTTPTDHWTDDAEATVHAQILAGLDWWQQQADVTFLVTTDHYTTTTDVLSLNSCRDRVWLPEVQRLTLFVVATTEQWLQCDGAPVADAGILGDPRITIAGMASYPYLDAIVAHSVAHLYGMRDGHTAPRTHDIMDRDYLIASYIGDYVAEETWTAIGATRRAGVPALLAGGRPEIQRRATVGSTAYSYKRTIGAL